ncbi:hypothetical protein NH340_JMT01645 [Sarcoptes scabiei]|nr:hypothetical protein NH340_JMT01645 [Sarcoptes scabiei]
MNRSRIKCSKAIDEILSNKQPYAGSKAQLTSIIREWSNIEIHNIHNVNAEKNAKGCNQNEPAESSLRSNNKRTEISQTDQQRHIHRPSIEAILLYFKFLQFHPIYSSLVVDRIQVWFVFNFFFISFEKKIRIFFSYPIHRKAIVS